LTTPERIEYSVGTDCHGRRVRLIRLNKRSSSSDCEWQIISEAVNQRDEGERCYSLTTQVLKNIGDIVNGCAE